jgi:hypothetical protein
MVQNNKKESNQYIFFVDMGGQPYVDDLFIGGIFINKKFITQFIKDFYNQFPYLRSFKKKSHNLNQDQLRDIINFMSQKRVKMVCIKFHKHKMDKYTRDILERKNRFKRKKVDLFHCKEKILGALYYQLFRVHARKGWHYEFEMCAESHLDVFQLMKALTQLAYRDGYPIHPRTNYRRIQHMLKFADFVAGAGRKLEDFVMRSFPHMVYLMPEIEQYDSDKLFGINDDMYDATAKLIKGNNLIDSSDVAVGNDSQKASEKTDIQK